MITHTDAETNIIFSMLQEARDDAIVKCGKMGTQIEQLSAEFTAAKAEIEALRLKLAELDPATPGAEPEPVVPAPAAE